MGPYHRGRRSIFLSGKRQRRRDRGSTYPCLSKDTSEEAANHSSNTMELEDIHSLVNLDPPVHVLAERANDSSEEANEGCNPWRDVTSSWRDSYKTSDGTGAGTNDGEFTLVANVLNG